MNKFFEDLKNKGKYLLEISKLDQIPEEAKSMFNSLKRKGIVKHSRKQLNTFYSNANFSAVSEMIESDSSKIKARSSSAKSPTDTLNAIKQRYNKITVAAGSPEILNGVNFFNVYVEMKTQEALHNHFPEAFNKVEIKYNLLHTQFASLQRDMANLAKSKGLDKHYNALLAPLNADIRAYADVLGLLK